MDFLQEKFKAPENAKLWAQVIAFAPVMFQAARCLREFGILKALLEAPEGLSFEELQKKADLSAYSLSVLLDAGESCALIRSSSANSESGSHAAADCQSTASTPGDSESVPHSLSTLSAADSAAQTVKRFFATEAAGFLENDPLTRANMNFAHDVCYKGLFELEGSLRHQRPEGLREFGEWPTIYEALTQLPPQTLKSWLEFDHFYSDDAFPRALPIVFKDQPKTVLDVGGNTGKFAVACAKYNPEVRVTILDYPGQLELAKQKATAAGVEDRVRFEPSRLLDHTIPFPKGFEVLWMSQFLDCFGEEDVLALMRRAREAMGPGSRLFIMEPFVDRQRYEAAKFCVNMGSLYFTALANGKSRFYRAEDFQRLLQAAGLEVEEELRVRLSHTILKCKISL